MHKTAGYITVFVLAAVITASVVHAHCQIPCGIYDDEARITLMKEHVTTIEKSMKKIEEGQTTNQATRWVMNKEQHADALSEIVTYYFMAQRIKPGCENYAGKLSQLHEILVLSMKAKQTTDLSLIEELRQLIHDFEHSYLGEEHKH